ncbi:class I SAM-dependent methyltransferase [Micromonospora echinaurantiaca]|uniref:class I SAM-dependent methyltransferase n=1 Tax=Micromonospora echinaurantiaca TaxID=47857 RepID=UPI003717C19E
MTTAFDDHERSRWAGRAAAYERSFAALCAHPASSLLDAAGVTAGTRVLDAGTGPGTVAALASARGATVVAVDAEPSMVETARRRVPAAEEVRQAALPHLPFPDDHVDAAVANFVLNHVGDPAAAVTELRRVVSAPDRIAVTIWPYPQPPLQRLWGQIFDAAGTGGAARPTASARWGC